MANRKHESDDVEVFRAAVRDVKPLKAKPRAAAPAPKKRKRRAPDAALPDLDEGMPLIAPPGESSDAGSAAVSYHRNGVRDQAMRKLRRGLYPVENELDLHGNTQAAARERLAEFLASA